MAKTNAQKQREYRERKKQQSDSFLEKERKRQKRYYKKTSELSKKQLKERRIAVKERVKRSREKAKIFDETNNQSSVSQDSDATVSPFIVSINFPKRGESSRKRRRQSDDKLYHKIAKLKNDKRKLELKCESLRKRMSRKEKLSSPLTPKRKTEKLLRTIGVKSSEAPEIKKQLLFAEAISLEIMKAGKTKSNKKESIRALVGGKILKKYRLLRYAATKTGTDRRKLSKVNHKMLNRAKTKRGFEPTLYAKVLEFYNRDDVSTALPGKRDAKKHKKKKNPYPEAST